jgi:hypothetical protein
MASPGKKSFLLRQALLQRGRKIPAPGEQELGSDLD